MTNQKQNAPGGGSRTLRAEKPANAEAMMRELAKRERISIEEARSKFAVPGALQYSGVLETDVTFVVTEAEAERLGISETEAEDDE